MIPHLLAFALVVIEATPDREMADFVLSGYETTMSRIKTVQGELDGYLLNGEEALPQEKLRFWLEDDRGRFSYTLQVPESKGQRSEVAFDSQWEQWLYIRP